MNSFFFYFREGILHITDWKGMDHLLFIAAFCLPFQLRDLKRIILPITGFTIGHSASLAFSMTGAILIPADTIEFLIPLTIMATALIGILKQRISSHLSGSYVWLISLFGLIHGMGFSNFLKSMLGLEETIVIPLLAFNTGLEAGQLLIILLALLLNHFVLQILKTKPGLWLLIGNSSIFGISLWLLTERWPF